MESIQQITIIGTGNVATQLALAFQENDVTISHIFGRNKEKREELCQRINAVPVASLKELPHQLTIICISDDAIKKIVTEIDDTIPIAYTSGSVEIATLKTRKNIGVFYPLQTFTKNKKVDFFNIPIFIEGSNDYFTQTLFDLAWKISRTVKYADSEERAKIHLAAVFTNNFTNHIIHLAQEYCLQENIDFNDLQPLLAETIQKLKTTSAYENQTGPAKRRDQKTIDSQLKKLTGSTKEIYEIMTKSIQNTYRKNEL